MNALPTLLAASPGASLSEPILATPHAWLWLIPALPALGAFINLLIGHRLQKMGLKHVASGIAIGAMGLATLLAWYLFIFELRPMDGGARYLHSHLWTMFSVGSLQADLAFALDPLSMVMVLIILTIGTGIHVYATGYMAEDPKYWKFFLYLNYFVFSMLLLVMGDNFLLMFFGWEGVGVASYLLIGFWWEDVEKAKAAMKAFVVNRFGDFGFVIGLFILFWALSGSFNGGGHVVDEQVRSIHGMTEAHTVQVAGEAVKVGPTLNFLELRNQVVIEETGVASNLTRMTLWGIPVLALVGIFFFIGATGKSAQIPLYTWLPDAMAGPTPVSALIHAATMVTAGVYMIARLNFVYALSPHAMTVVAVVGAATAIFAATIGFFQHDIKKVLAYSTVSQLGFMFIAVGVGAYWVGVFHLLTHAVFKACLFLGSGSVIHGCHHEQDMRKMGGLKKYMPITHATYLIACLAITGVIFFNGFFSKDEILWYSLRAEHLLVPGQWIFAVGLMAAACTAYYMWRSYFFTFWGEYRGEAHGHGSTDDHTAVTHHAAHAAKDADEGHGAGAHDHGDDHGHGHGGLPHESPWSMTGVLVFLAAGCVLTGILLFSPWFGAPFSIRDWLYPVMAGAQPHLSFASAPPSLMYLLQGVGGVLIPALGAGIAWYFYAGKGQALRDKLAAGEPVGIFRPGWYKPVHALVLDKYRVDELYDATVVRPSTRLAERLSWFDRTIIDGAVNVVGHTVRVVCEIAGAIDRHLIDGLVTGVAGALMKMGRGLRTLQAQRFQTYLYTVLGGALFLVLLNYVLF
jgi:NADH-quinone oxidoreductase subunit L